MTQSFRYSLPFRDVVARRLMAILLAAATAPLLHARDSDLAQSSPSTAVQTGGAQEVTTLELGKVIERELSGGQKHDYRVVVSAGEYMSVEITDQGTDVGVLLQTPEGDTRRVWMPFAGKKGLKRVHHVAELPGIFKISVYAAERASPGRYEIRLADLHPATENDRALHEASQLLRQYSGLRDQGRWLEARPLLLRCLEIQEKVLGPDDLVVAETLGVVASNYDNAGDYAKAELFDLRTLKIKEKILGPDHLDVAQELFNLGVSYRNRDDYLKAEEMQRRAWGILERTQQTETPIAAALLEELGNTEYVKANYQSAEDYFRRGRAVWEKLFGPDHYHLAPSFTFSGWIAYAQGDYPRAEMMFQKALALGEKALGPEHLTTTKYRNDLAMLYCTTGDYARGEALYQKSLATYELKAAMGYPPAQTTLFGLARCFAAQGDWPEAVKFQSRASEIAEHYVAVNIVEGSEREKHALFHDLSLLASRSISLQTQFAHDDATALHLAVSTVLKNKGRVQDAVANTLTALRQRFGPGDQRILDQLSDLTSQLAKLVLNGPQRLTAAEYSQHIKALEDQREQLEEEMNRRTAGFYQTGKTVTLGAVQAAVPENAALVEFAVYRPFDAGAPDNQKAYGAPRYVVYVIRNQGEVKWRELGEAHAIDQSIDDLRQALRDPQRRDVRRLARVADERIMRPVRSLIDDAAHLLVSPDGDLNLVPFEALVDERGRYLTENYSITYLTTGRDLLRMQVPRESRSGPIVVANPLFGEPGTAHLAGPGQPRVRPISFSGKPRSIIAGEDLSSVYFAPLDGTAREARAIQSLFPDARVLTGAEATKNALQRLIAPRILHIATHGFFLQDLSAQALRKPDGPSANGDRNIVSGGKVANPLLRSGLALTGANLNKDGNEDGILTALEASNLNLWGTKLVTLSACETGVGEVKDGEGVYGLRRSFFLAGSETLVMSLWSVSDRVTREMMTAYYTGLKQGLGRGEALRRAELAMLKRKDRQHPFYWASFIQSGEWANLDGER